MTDEVRRRLLDAYAGASVLINVGVVAAAFGCVVTGFAAVPWQEALTVFVGLAILDRLVGITVVGIQHWRRR